MEHQQEQIFARIFQIIIYADEKTLELIDKPFIEDSIATSLSDSHLCVSNWEVNPILSIMTFKKGPEQSCSVGYSEKTQQGCCIPFFQDDRKWKEYLNILREIYDLKYLAKKLGVRPGWLKNVYKDIIPVSKERQQKIYEVYNELGRRV